MIQSEDKVRCSVGQDEQRSSSDRSPGEAVMFEDPGTFVVTVIVAAILITKWRLMLAIIATIIVALVITGIAQVLTTLNGIGA
jgi:hypothetical protein